MAPSTYSPLIHPGTSITLPVKVNPSGGFTGPVALTLINLPQGVTADPAILSVEAGSTGTFTLTAAINADAAAFPAKGPGDSIGGLTHVTLQGQSGTLIRTTLLTLEVYLSTPAFAPDAADINLPVISITTTDAAPVVSKDDYLTASMTITPPAGSSSASYSGTLQIKGHGNTTWSMPKKPYKLKLNSKAALLGMPSNKDWILLANYDDKSLLRDYVSYELGNRVGFAWSPRSVFAELYLNGQYEGTYELSEQVKVDTNRVDINEMAETDTSGAALTGGYLMEIDNRAGDPEDFEFTTPNKITIGLIDPDFTPEVPEQTSYIQAYVLQAEAALYSKNYQDPVLGWRAYFDEQSLINFYLVNDIMGNHDGGDFYSSDYLYKNINDPHLYMGPVWDFDVSSGNDNYGTIESPTAPWMRIRAPWYARLFSDPGFKADVAARFNALKASEFDTLPAFIDQSAATLSVSQENNFQRWNTIGETVWPNPQAFGTYQGEVDYLKSWVTQRIAYLDATLNQ
jgi:hypothetical protein